MAWERFYLALDLDVEVPYPTDHKTHYDEGQPVLVNTGGALYAAIRDRLRPEDGHDKIGQAAVVLREAGDVPRPSGRARGLSS